MKKSINLGKAIYHYKEAEISKSYALQYALQISQNISVFARRYYDQAKEQEALHRTELEKILNECDIKSALNEAQSKAKVRTISVDDIIYYLWKAEEALSIPKSALNGVSVEIDPNAQNFPNAYKGIPESTIFTAIYKSGSWKIQNIRRDRTKSEKQQIVVNHTEASKKALIDRLTAFRL